MGRKIVLIEKIAVVIATILLVAATTILINQWRDRHLFTFFFTGQYENLFYLLVFSFSLAYLLKKLAQWEFHKMFAGRKRR